MSSTSHACKPNQNAERLKAQGNEFHQKGQYKAAYRQYTEAIKQDPKNAVYYANRAASSLAMKEFMDAAHDARKATELDPAYAKAWGRLGTAEFALTQWSKSIQSWNKALQCLPSTKDQDTEAEKKLRIQFTEGLKKAEDMLKKPPIDPSRMREHKIGNMPWDHALALEKDLIAAQKLSSAFVILFAYREYKEGVDAMKCLHQKPINGTMAWVGKPDALVGISNGVMRDPRVFHLDIPDWFDKYNRQAMFSAEAHKAWNMGGAKTVIESAPLRLKQEGWTGVRPALSTTIRAWLMCGLMAKSTGRFLVSLEYYSRVVDVLDWGCRVWHDVPKEERGAIFQPTFVRGVKRMRLTALHECLGSGTQGCQYSMDDLAEWCRDIISETEANPPSNGMEIDAGFLLSFWIYPRAEALSLLGWYHMQLGLSANSASVARHEFTQSSKYYIESAGTFPDDDEDVPTFLKVAIEAYFFLGRPLKDIIPLIMRIEETIPNVLKLWANSPAFEVKEPHLQHILDWAQDVENGLANGRFTVEDVVKPKSMETQDKWKTGVEIYI